MTAQPKLTRARLVDGALPQIRLLLTDEARLATVADAHRAAKIWLEHVFLEELDGRWYLWSYTESDDSEASAQLATVDSPEFAEIRDLFRSSCDEMHTIEYQTSILSPPGP